MKKMHWCSAVMIVCNLAMIISAAESLFSEYRATRAVEATPPAVSTISAREKRKSQRPARADLNKGQGQERPSTDWFPFSRRDVWIIRAGCLVCAADAIWLMCLAWLSGREQSKQLQAEEDENFELRQFANRCIQERDRSVTLLVERNQLLARVVEERDGWRALANREHHRAQELESYVYVDENDLKGVLKESSHCRH